MDYFDLGHLDAKKDVNLKNYFIEPSQYQQIFELKKSIIVGRRGTGKTALAKMLTNDFKEDENNLVIQIANYDPFILGTSDTNSTSDYQMITLKLSWLEFILYNLFNEINSFGKNSILSKKTIKLQRRYGLLKRSKYQKLTSFLKRIQVKIKNSEIKLSPKDQSALNDNYEKLKDIERNIKTDLSESQKKIIILIDELDKLEKTQDYETKVYSLLEFVYNISMESPIRAIVFIRQDIYQELTGYVMPKIKGESYDLDMIWNEETLKLMIKKRIEVSSEGMVDFKMIFPAKSELSIGRNQEVYAYALQRTFYRPRDLINYSQQIINVLSKNKGYKSDYYNQAEIAYSQKLVGDISEEYQKQLSLKYGIEDLPIVLIKSLTGTQVKIDRTELEKILESVKYIKENKINTEQALHELYVMGAIGFDLASGRSDKGFYHANPSQIKLLKGWTKKFIVHHGLRKSLLP